MDIKNNCQVDLDEEGKYTGQTITYGNRFFRVLKYNFDKSEISGAGEKDHGFGVTTIEERGRRCVGLIYRRTIVYVWLATFIFTDFRGMVRRLDEAYGNIS